MAIVELGNRRPRVREFHSAVIGSLESVAGLFILGSILWHFPPLRFWGTVLIAVFMLLIVWQLWRIRRIYAVAYPTASSDDSGILAKTLTEVIRTFFWGNAMFLLLAIACMFAFVQLR